MLASSTADSMATQPIRLWPASGRIGRARLVAYSLAAHLGLGLLGALLVFASGVGGSLLGLLLLCAMVFSVALLVQRSHDLGISGWWVIVAVVVPLASLYWLLAPGTPGENRYGAPPRPNTTGVLVMAWVLPVMLVLSLFAAVALPAYADYTVRAKVADTINALQDCRRSVAEAYRRSAVPPAGGWGCPEGGDAGQFATRLSVGRNGGITVTLRGTGSRTDGRRITFEPVTTDGSSLRASAAPAQVAGFRCLSPAQDGVPERYLPGSCRR